MSITPIKNITFHVKPISNGFIVTDGGKEVYYPGWTDIISEYFMKPPKNFGIGENGVFVEFTVSYPISNK